MKEAIRLSLALGLTCAVASGVLAFADARTRSARNAALMAERQKALGLVLPDSHNNPFEDRVNVTLDGRSFTFYPARTSSGDTAAVAGEGTSPQGFGGDLSVLVGLDSDGGIRKVLVTGHKETPGLGTQATDRKARRSFWSLFRGADSATCAAPPEAQGVPPCAYLDRYDGLSVDDAPFTATTEQGKADAARSAVLAVSGATISSRAVADAVSQISKAFRGNRTVIMAQP